MHQIPITYIRIKQLRQARKMSQGELALKTGYTDRSTIAKIEAGKIDLGQKKLIVFAEALETSTAYLMGLTDDPAPKRWNVFDTLPPNLVPLETTRIPLVGTIACGTPILAQENIEGYVDLPKHIKADFALTCEGDSMIEAGIKDGDVVYIRTQPEVQNGQIAAVLVDGERATLKRFYFDNGIVTLMAANQAYPPIIRSGADLEQVKVLGLAVAFTRPLV
ncbi:MAG: helix-turn-helix domain-containing protein [Negativibacillus sp.]